MKNLMLILSIFFINQIGFAQIPDSEMPVFQEKAKRLVAGFTNELSNLVSTSDEKIKLIYVESAISRFQKDATIEVSNARTGDIFSYPINEYVRDNVAGYTDKYAIVVISFEAIELSKFKEKRGLNGEVYYECKFKFVQVFSASKDQLRNADFESNKIEWSYVDRTKKRGSITVKETYGPTGKKWQVSIGDIEVEETELLN